MVSFSQANSKLEKLAQNPNVGRFLTADFGRAKKVYSFDLLAGFSCPSAKDCQAFAVLNKATGKRKIVDGKASKFRCYAASGEVQYDGAYNKHKANFEAIKASDNIYQDLGRALPLDAGVVRIHSSGDFFKLEYLQAWIKIAKRFPEVMFYGYTKSIEWLIKEMPNFPPNLKITASRGGVQDNWIDAHDLPEAVVVYSEAEAAELDLPIDSDDSYAANPDYRGSFALVIHGTQPKGSEAGKAWQAIKTKRRQEKLAAEAAKQAEFAS